ncbi:Lipin/Ned1/Smp2-domain-containing protein [Abortiporus biennis]|nr:Lipin/Ned1/Smp2-domain-containing protein [Abortiporus biennis]
MNYLRGAVSAISVPYQYYRDLNPSTLTGAIDVIVISRPKELDGKDEGGKETKRTPEDERELVCSPFHVRFGKWQVLRPADKKVDVFVNGKLVPFPMKIGDAGEAFFVFETDENVPEDLVTSPLLEATQPGQSNAQGQPAPTGRFGAKESDIEEEIHLPESSQEPDFLDLDGTGQRTPDDLATIDEATKLTSPDVQENGKANEKAPSFFERTKEIGQAVVNMVQEVEKSQTDKFKDKTIKEAANEIKGEEETYAKDSLDATKNAASSYLTFPEKGDEALPNNNNVEPPEVLYTHGMVFDMEGYHSHSRDVSEETVRSADGARTSSFGSPSTSRSPSVDRTPGPSRSPSPEVSSSSSFGGPIPFPMRAISEPPPDMDVGVPSSPPSKLSPQRTRSTNLSTAYASSSANNSSLKLTLPPQEYSWEWGNFPQKTPVRTAFDKVSTSANKGKGRMLSDEDTDYWTSGIGGTKHNPKLSHNASSDDEDYNNADKMFGSGGLLTVDRRDPTKFRVFIEGRTAEFEMSIIPPHSHGASGFRDGEDEFEDARRFDEGKIDFTTFLEDESILKNENLVLRWAGDQYITRRDGSPLIDAIALWREGALRSKSANQLISSRPVSPAASDRVRRAQSVDSNEPLSGDESTPTKAQPEKKPSSSSWVRWWSRSRKESESSRPDLRPTNSAPSTVPNRPDDLLLPVPRPPRPSESTPTLPVEARGRSTELSPVSSSEKPVEKRKYRKRYAKTLRLTSDQLKSLDLKPGPNTVTFSLSSTGVAACTARLFVWDSSDLIVVSDIDGTITKSDALGHVFTMIGRDWTHLGVAKLYTDICRNGYKIMYLTSRAIGQADSTRDYLKGIKQNDYQLPEGPVVMSPDRLMASLHREVIMRKPEVFKMACLRDIQRLFGTSNHYPFYAGFGNRITDALSYRSVNVPSSRIFTIDSSGEVKMELLELAGYKSSYIHMTDLVDQMFPPIHRQWAAEYTDFNYWKTPMQDFPLPDLSPPSPALSARSDTSNQSALARLRNFSLVGSRQSNNMGRFTLPPPATEGDSAASKAEDRRKESHLRQMSSFERLSSTLASFASSPTSGTPRSTTPTSYDSGSGSEDEDGTQDDVEKGQQHRRRRQRTRSVSSMPGSLPGSNDSDDEVHFGVDEEEHEGGEGEGDEYEGENEEEAAEEAFDEDFLATGEMENVPFL